MGFTGQATFWLAADLHVAVMPRICDALGRLIVSQHPDSCTGPGGENVAVDLKVSVQLEKDASTTYTESPWAQDMSADIVVSQAPIQSVELVPPRSVARRQPSPGCCHALSRILSAVEAAQAGLYRALDPEQQTIMLSAAGPGQQILIHSACISSSRISSGPPNGE